MRDTISDVLKVNAINGGSIAFLTLTQVKDVVAILLGLVSIISTLIIIKQNVFKQTRKDK